MAISRAFSMHSKRSDVATKRSGSIRHHISSPIALLSTTNMLSYTAPDIAKPASNLSSDKTFPSAPSTPDRSSIDNDSDSSSPSDASTAATSVESSPVSDRTHSYFGKPSTSLSPTAATVTEDMPALPKRALSHSKREHERLARKRSQRFSRPSSAQSIIEPLSTRGSVADQAQVAEQKPIADTSAASPFGRELEQLSEIVEEFGTVAREVAVEEDLAVMKEGNLQKFTVDEYLQEIQPLWISLLNDWHSNVDGEAWI